MSHEKKKQWKNGAEVPDQTRRSLPVTRAMPTRFEDFQRMLRTASLLAKEQGYDSVDEWDDFDVGEEDPLPDAKWELEFDNVLGKEISKGEKAFLDKQRQDFTRKYGKEPPWWRRVFQKNSTKTNPEPLKGTPEEDPKGSPQE